MFPRGINYRIHQIRSDYDDKLVNVRNPKRVGTGSPEGNIPEAIEFSWVLTPVMPMPPTVMQSPGGDTCEMSGEFVRADENVVVGLSVQGVVGKMLLSIL